MEAVLEIEVIPAPAFSWKSQARQYADTGVPGLQHEQHMVDLETGDEVFDVPASMAGPHITVINCLLYRDDAGVLVGILNHYDGRHELEKADAVNIWVRPDWQCRGIGSALVVEALRRWPGVRPEGQRYTDSGVRLLESLLRRSEQQ